MAADTFLEDEATDDDVLPPGMTREQFDAWIAEGDADIAAGRDYPLEEVLAAWRGEAPWPDYHDKG